MENAPWILQKRSDIITDTEMCISVLRQVMACRENDLKRKDNRVERRLKERSELN